MLPMVRSFEDTGEEVTNRHLVVLWMCLIGARTGFWMISFYFRWWFSLFSTSQQMSPFFLLSLTLQPVFHTAARITFEKWNLVLLIPWWRNPQYLPIMFLKKPKIYCLPLHLSSIHSFGLYESIFLNIWGCCKASHALFTILFSFFVRQSPVQG